MTDATARLALPMIVPGQAQKEMSHNEALAILDAVVQASVAGFAIDAPPATPADGACWIVGAAPTGAWAGHADEIAAWTAGGWRFVVPTPGFRAWVIDDGDEAQFVDGAWVVRETLLSTPVAPIADPAGGATIDVQARTAIAAILTALRHHHLVIAA